MPLSWIGENEYCSGRILKYSSAITLVLRQTHSKFLKFHFCWKQNSIKFIWWKWSYARQNQSRRFTELYVDYRFLVINSCHSVVLEYFFHYNHDLNSNKWTYFKSESSNSLKVYIFGMCKLRGKIWCIIHTNWMLLKNRPHLTFGWPFVNISQTIHPMHRKL